MKKILSTLLAAACLIACFTLISSANDISSPVLASEELISVEYFEDGSYLVRTRKQSSFTTPFSAKGAIFEKTGSDDFDYYFSDNSLQWTYTIHGIYTVETGVSATCISSTYTFTAHKSGWSLTNPNNSYAGNTAYGSGTAVKKVLFVTTHTHTFNVSLSCDVYGNLS